MIEARRDLELPSVLDSAPDANEQLAEVMKEAIDGVIPGVGIDHGEDDADDSESNFLHTHKRHVQMLLMALDTLGIRRTNALVHDAYISRDASICGLFHVDPRPYQVYGAITPSQFDCFQLDLRLHTSAPGNGAEVVLANSTPGLARTAKITADELFNADELLEEQFEIHPAVVSELASNTRYTYTERPLSSVIIRSSATLGSVSIHRFSSIDPNVKRDLCISDVRILSQ